MDATLEKGRQARVQADFRALSSTLMVYRISAGSLPSLAQGLGALIDKPTVEPIPKRWTQLMAKYPVDPWGFPYGYDVRKKDGKEQYFLISKGPDREDAKDDIEYKIDPEGKVPGNRKPADKATTD